MAKKTTLKLKIKKLREDAYDPTYAHDTDAGMDLRATSVVVSTKDNIITYGTGLSFEIPEGYVGLLFPRSSLYKTGLTLTNCVGVIDSGYRGEVSFKFKAPERNPRAGYEIYKVGDKIGQMIIMPYPKIEIEFADELSDSDRGEGGYGSTGR